MGKVIDAEFGGHNAHDRYCASCRERFPRASALCPRCGGALVLWARQAATDQRQRRRDRLYGVWGLALAAFLVLCALLLTAAR